MDSKQLKKNYLSILPNKPTPGKKIVIFMIGIIGSGKSHLAEKLSEEFDMYIARNDNIRRFFNEHGIPGKAPMQMLLQDIAETSGQILYERGISHIVDADMLKFVDVAVKNAVKHNFTPIFIHVTAPEDVIKARLGMRSHESENQSRAGYKSYKAKREIYDKMPLPDKIFFTIDTSKNFDEQFEKLVSKIRTLLQ